MGFVIRKAATKSSDGIHDLNGVLYIPDGEIKGLFHIIHGMTEHMGRYHEIMEALANEGYLAFGYDNLGHGTTAADDSELGFIASENGWEHLVDDTFRFASQVMALYPDKKLTVMGHSMGSFIARIAALKYGKYYSKLIICGTAGPNVAAPFGLLITNILKKLKGERYVSPLTQKIAFGTYNKRFEKDSPYNWLTKDKEIIEKYAADKFCTFKFCVCAMHDLIMLISLANSKTWFKEIDSSLPLLLISGEDDPVGNYGKGVKTVFDGLKKNSKENVQLKLYENCRHEILNDTCKQEVTQDILNFLGEE